MHNKDKVIFDKKLPYEYNICLYVLEELCDKGVIDVFEMTEAIILLRRKYKMPVIDIYGKKTIIPATKKLGKELIKEASPEHKLRVCAYVRVSTESEEQLESFNAQIGRYKRIIQKEHADIWEYVGIFADTESGTSIDKRGEFQDMMDKCREGLIDLILVKQMSRFGRNTINTLQAIYELRNLGVEVYFETDKKETEKDDFRRLIPSIIQKEKRFVESLETRKNGQIISYKIWLLKICRLYFFIDSSVEINLFIKIDLLYFLK